MPLNAIISCDSAIYAPPMQDFFARQSKSNYYSRYLYKINLLEVSLGNNIQL